MSTRSLTGRVLSMSLAGAMCGCAGAPTACPWRAEDHIPDLGVGDPAPPLLVDHWVKGEPIRAFAPGRIYVVDFWATWCASCIAGFPELAELQRDFAERGVAVIAATNADSRGCTLDEVRRMARHAEANMDFAVAFSDDARMYRQWVLAAGHRGIPTTFVVAGNGRLASVGYTHAGTMSTDREVIERLLAGTFDWEAEAAWWRVVMLSSATERRFARLLRESDPSAFSFARDEMNSGPLGQVASSLNAVAEMILYHRPPDDGGAALRPDLDLAYEAASRAFAMNRDPDDIWYYGVLAEAEFRTGNPGRAVELIRHALEHAGEFSTEFYEERLAAYENALGSRGSSAD